MMKKKAQGLPINTIIIAIIVIVVLVVLVMIFTGALGIFAVETSNCKSIGSQDCFSSCNANDGWTRAAGNYKCLGADKKPIPGMTCCVQTGVIPSWTTCESLGYAEVEESVCINGAKYEGQLDAVPAGGEICCTAVCSDVRESNICEVGDDEADPPTDDVLSDVRTESGDWCCD